MDEQIDLMTVPEAAKILKISPIGVRRIIASDAIRYHRIRGSVRIDRADINAYLATVFFKIVVA